MSSISGVSNINMQELSPARPQGATPQRSAPADNPFDIKDVYTPSQQTETLEEDFTYSSYARAGAGVAVPVATETDETAIMTVTENLSEVATTTISENVSDVQDDTNENTNDNAESSDDEANAENSTDSDSNASTDSNTSTGNGIDTSDLTTRYDNLYTQDSSGNNLWSSSTGSSNSSNNSDSTDSESESNSSFSLESLLNQAANTLSTNKLLTTQSELNSFRDSILANIETQNKSLSIFKNMMDSGSISDDDMAYLKANNDVMYKYASGMNDSSTDSNTSTDSSTSTDTNADAETNTSTDETASA